MVADWYNYMATLIDRPVGFLFSEHDLLIIREIMNGMWFVLSLALLFAYVTYALTRLRGGDAYRSAAIQAAVALAVFMLGSSVRSGFIWLLLSAQNAHNQWLVKAISDRYEILFYATLFMTVGALCCFRVFTPARWSPFSWLFVGTLGVTIPLMVHFYLN